MHSNTICVPLKGVPNPLRTLVCRNILFRAQLQAIRHFIGHRLAFSSTSFPTCAGAVASSLIFSFAAHGLPD